MKRTRNVLWAVVVIGLTSALAARMSAAPQKSEPAGGTRVAVVDLVKVFNDFERTKAVQDKMREYRETINLEGDRRMAEIQAEEDILAKTATNSPDWRTRRTKISRLRLENEVWKQLKNQEAAEDFVAAMKETYQIVTDGIAEVAKKQDAQLVVTKEEMDTSVTRPEALLQQIYNRKVVYSDGSVDISAKVLATLNASFLKAGGAASVRLGT